MPLRLICASQHEMTEGACSMTQVDTDALFDLTDEPDVAVPPRFSLQAIDTVDLYAGAGGIDEGLRMLDPSAKNLGAEKWPVACVTARNAGHERWDR